MLAVINAVGQVEREAMLERRREGIAKAKREGRYKGRVATALRQSDEISGSRMQASRPPKSRSGLVSVGPASIGCWPDRTAVIERLREWKTVSGCRHIQEQCTMNETG
jgi:hypothetical protein